MTVIEESPDELATQPYFVSWLKEERCFLKDGTSVSCWCLEWESDDTALDAWALHMRRHYIGDKKLKFICEQRREKPETYLPRVVIPEEKDPRHVRNGDFAEILISDVLEYLLQYAVPRYKQCGRKDKNTSEHGTDVIAYQINEPRGKTNTDRLLAVEVKSDASGTTEKQFLQRVKKATDDSKKDPNRVPMTLDYMIDQAINAEDFRIRDELIRFTDKGGLTFETVYGSAVITSYGTPNYVLSGKSPSEMNLRKDELLIIVHAQKFTELINSLYNRMIK